MTDRMPPDAMGLQIAHKEEIAQGIYVFELRDPSDAELPPFTGGAHITLQTPSGLIRKYSLCNDPAERDRYLVAIKREQPGRGGSADLIDNAPAGGMLPVARPVNDFELPPRATDLLFIAGGIGITPMMAMINQLRAEPGKRFRLFYCTRSPEATAFLQELSVPEFKGKVKIHHDRAIRHGRLICGRSWNSGRNREHLYCCGPRALMRRCAI